MSYRHSTMVDSLPSNAKASNKSDEVWKTNKVRPNNTEGGWKMSSRLKPAQLNEDYKRQSMPAAPLSEHSSMIAGWTPKPITQETTKEPFNVIFPPENSMINHHQPHQLYEPINAVYSYEQPYLQQPQLQQPLSPPQQEPFNYTYSQETFQEPHNVVFHPPEHFTIPYHSSPALNNTNYTHYTDDYPSTNDYPSHEYISPPPPLQHQQSSFQEHPYQEQQLKQERVKEEEKKKNSDIKSDDRVGRITVQSVNSDYIVWINLLPNDTGLVLAERIRNIATMRTKKIVSITSHSGRKIPLDNRPIFGNWMELSSFKDGEKWEVEWRDNDRGVVDRLISKLF